MGYTVTPADKLTYASLGGLGASGYSVAFRFTHTGNVADPNNENVVRAYLENGKTNLAFALFIHENTGTGLTNFSVVANMTDGTGKSRDANNITVSQNAWHTLVVTIGTGNQGSSIHYYLDGVELTYTSTVNATGSTLRTLACMDFGETFDQGFAPTVYGELAVANKVLTSQERADYESGVNPIKIGAGVAFTFYRRLSTNGTEGRGAGTLTQDGGTFSSATNPPGVQLPPQLFGMVVRKCKDTNTTNGLQNTNISGNKREVKCGPTVVFDTRALPGALGAFMNFSESVKGTGGTAPTITDVGFADTPFGTFTFQSDTDPVLVGSESIAATNNEFSAAAVLMRADGPGWEVMAHGGGTLQGTTSDPTGTGVDGENIWYAKSADYTALKATWTIPQTLPTFSRVNAYELQQISDMWVIRSTDPTFVALNDGFTHLAFYRARAVGGVAGGSVARAAANSLAGLQNGKYSGNPVIVAGAGGSGFENGIHSLVCWWDPIDGVLHGIASGQNGSNANQCFYFYSFDLGKTWILGNTSPVVPLGSSGEVDEGNAGDVPRVLLLPDTVVQYYGTDNPGFPGGAVRGICIGAYPRPTNSPTTAGGRWYYPGSRPCTTLPSTAVVRNSNVFTICGEFRCPRFVRAADSRMIYAEEQNFNNLAYVRVQQTTGKLEAFVRTPTGTIVDDLLSTNPVDTGMRVRWALIRTASNAFQLWVDGVQVDSSTRAPGLDATATLGAGLGNWPSATGEPDQELDGSLLRFGLCKGTAFTWAQVDAFLNDGTVPGGATMTVTSAADGTDSGSTVYVVDAAADSIPQPVPRRARGNQKLSLGLSLGI